jgi:hypothetical protein
MTETPQANPPSDLVAILLKYKHGEADWPTTKEALLTFPYTARATPPPMSDRPHTRTGTTPTRRPCRTRTRN